MSLSITALALAWMAVAPPEADAPTDTDAPAPAPATEDAATADETEPPATGDPADEPAPEPEVEPKPEPESEPEPEPDPEGPRYTVVQGKPGPPYSTEAEHAALRSRYGLSPTTETGPDPARFKRAFRCFLADPSCGFNVEINATSAYAYRLRQGDVSVDRDINTWHSGRAQYDLWVNFPAATEVLGTRRYTRITLGPKGGVAASDSHDIWGNAGMAMRAFLGRGSWAPTIEFTTALSFQLRGERGADGERIGPVRSPVGLTADVGFGVGGLGAIVFGGQFDPPLAREDLPERVRVSTGGAFFVGFRGNILWGLPAAGAVTTQALVHRRVESP